MDNETDIEKLLPHKRPMIVLNGIREYNLNEGTLTAFVNVKKTDILYSEKINGIPACSSLEYMAQAIGCFVGYHDIVENPSKTPGIGFVMGTRKLEVFIPVFKVNETYFIDIKSAFCDGIVTSFECKITDKKGVTVAKAILNAYRPTNIDDFMKDITNE